MKILIASDGSECSQAAMDDLKNAGLPDTGEMVVLSVAEVWPDLQTMPYHEPGLEGGFGAMVINAREIAEQKIAQHNDIARRGAESLRAAFPRWKIQSEAALTSSMRGILSKADSWKPDLIVVGSHGTSAIGRIFMGSISHSVLTHAPCSVRIGRGEATKTQSPPRILIGVDGSAEAAHAVRVVANRTWPAGTEARVIAVIDSTMRTAVPVTHAFAMEWMQMPSEDPKIWTRAVGRAVVELKEGGVSATSRVTEGDPKRVILDEAKAWPATCIFVGARGLGRVLRILLGSVSLAVASRATCSVEVVRSPELA